MLGSIRTGYGNSAHEPGGFPAPPPVATPVARAPRCRESDQVEPRATAPVDRPTGAAPGLTTAEARARLRQDGPNVLAASEPPHWTLRFARNFSHLFALLLWAGAALAWVGGQPQLSVAIVAVIVVNAVFSFVQEYRAEQAVDALRRI